MEELWKIRTKRWQICQNLWIEPHSNASKRQCILEANWLRCFKIFEPFEISGIKFKNAKLHAPSQLQTFKQWAFGYEIPKYCWIENDTMKIKTNKLRKPFEIMWRSTHQVADVLVAGMWKDEQVNNIYCLKIFEGRILNIFLWEEENSIVNIRRTHQIRTLECKL